MLAGPPQAAPVGCMGRQMELEAGSTCRQEASPEGQRLSGLHMALGRQGLEDDQLRGMGREGPAPMRMSHGCSMGWWQLEAQTM